MCIIEYAEQTTYKWIKARYATTVKAGTVIAVVNTKQSITSLSTSYNDGFINKVVQTNDHGTHIERIPLRSGQGEPVKSAL